MLALKPFSPPELNPTKNSSSTSPLSVSPTEPPKNSSSDKNSSTPKPLNTLRSTLINPTPSPSATTSCPPGPLLSTKNFSDSKVSQRTKPSRPSPPLRPQPPRTGDPSEPSTPSRTNNNAVHAGLSLPPPPSNLLKRFKMVETSSPSPNKSWLPATPVARMPRWMVIQ